MCSCEQGKCPGDCPCGCNHTVFAPACDASEWKPGDVAIVSSDFIPPERRIYGEYPPGENGCWYVGHGGFVRAENVTNVRPLIVIDPEDAEQVERLCDLLYGGHMGNVAARTKHALHEFARPTPRIEEPGLVGALVIDDDSEWWVRRHSGHWECLAGPPGADVRTWAALENDYGPLRILSPGVPS